jgi:hypothetical protein
MAEARGQRRIAVHRDGVARFAERVRRQAAANRDGGSERGDGNAADQSGSDSLLIGQIYHMPGRGPCVDDRLEPGRELGYVTGAQGCGVTVSPHLALRQRDGAPAPDFGRRAKDIS